MIDPHWNVVDLDPRTWRNIGRFFDPGQYIRAAEDGEHGLFVLHNDGKVLRVVDSKGGVRADLGVPDHIDNPTAFAHQLYNRGEWQRVHVINKRHLADVARLAQTISNGALHLDAYYANVYQLLWDGGDGYVSVPARTGSWHGWTYQGVQQFVGQLPIHSSLALGVFEGERLEIGLIFELEQGIIKTVTTFEALPEPDEITRPTVAVLDQLWQQLSQRFLPPAAALLCTAEVFERWIKGEQGKYELLREAIEQGQAALRQRES